jgi:hypothetical protein
MSIMTKGYGWPGTSRAVLFPPQTSGSKAIDSPNRQPLATQSRKPWVVALPSPHYPVARNPGRAPPERVIQALIGSTFVSALDPWTDEDQRASDGSVERVAHPRMVENSRGILPWRSGLANSISGKKPRLSLLASLVILCFFGCGCSADLPDREPSQPGSPVCSSRSSATAARPWIAHS